MKRARHVVPVLLAAAGAVVACGAPPVARTTSLRLRGEPRDAQVLVDEQMIGTLDMVIGRGVALPAGRHFLTVKKAGYLPFDKIVDVASGDGPVLVEVKLTPFPE